MGRGHIFTSPVSVEAMRVQRAEPVCPGLHSWVAKLGLKACVSGCRRPSSTHTSTLLLDIGGFGAGLESG